MNNTNRVLNRNSQIEKFNIKRRKEIGSAMKKIKNDSKDNFGLLKATLTAVKVKPCGF